MAEFLKNVMQAHEQLGIPIDENTQALIDQAQQAGILGKDTKSATDIMRDGLSDVVGTLGLLIQAMGHDVPDAVQTAIDNLNKIPKDINTNVNVTYTDPGFWPHANPNAPSGPGIPETGGPPAAEGADIPPTASGGVVTKPQIRLVGEAGPEAIIPLDRLPSLLPHPIGAIGFQNGFFDQLTDAGRQAGSTLTSAFGTAADAVGSLRQQVEATRANLATDLPTASKKAASQMSDSFRKVATDAQDVQGVFLGMPDQAQLITDRVAELTAALGLTQDQADDLRRAFEEGARQVDRGFMSNAEGVNHVTRGLSDAIDATKTYARSPRMSTQPSMSPTTIHGSRPRPNPSRRRRLRVGS
jgi:hypothetical protein